MTTASVEFSLNLIGLFAFAVSGAILAVRQQFDIIGMAVLATITALGGGVVRDALIGDVPVAALRNTWWLAVPLVATVFTFFFHPQVVRLRRAVHVFDAIGLGMFCAAATAKSLAFGLGPLAAVMMGAITGIGGGIMRDLLAGVKPAVLSRDSKLYTIPAVLGSIAVAVGDRLDAPPTPTLAASAVGITVLRLLALWRGWKAPTPKAPAG